jgi:tRNA nucleotidyltransferase/poly(A) polymerase
VSKGRDNKSEGPKVNLNVTVIDDILRRDLTCNALLYDINKKQIIDYVDGISDIQNNIIRAVGEPNKRFEEDRLRLLRTVRQTARSNAKLDKKTKEAIIADNRLNGISSIDDVSQERVIEEFEKMRKYAEQAKDMPMFMYYLKLLDELKMFDQMFPTINITIPKKELPSFKNELIFPILFQNNHTNNKVINYMVLKLKIPYDIVKHFRYFTDFKADIKNYKNAPILAKAKKASNIHNNDLITYCEFMSIDKQYYMPFLKYCRDGFITSGEEVIAQGFEGKERGDEIIRREIENYKKNYLFI